MKEQKPNRLQVVLILLLLVVVSFSSGILLEKNNQGCSEIKQVIYLEELEYELLDYVASIYDYYEQASNAYDILDYDNVINYCLKSRDESKKYSQKLREIKVEYPETLTPILQVRKEMIDKEIEYLFALYQSCEYLESASRAYKSENWDMGNVNIEGQNEQIAIHDSKIEEYYNLEARYNKLKKELVQ
jgi:hypothetical protein